MTSTTPLAGPRMSNPAALLDGASGAIFALMKAARQTDLPHSTLELVHLRVSQINGCSVCVDSGVRSAKQAGETDERLHAVVAWRETPYFTDEERAQFTALLDAGFTDTFRHFHPDATDRYSWWSYRFKARERNAGWRIDYFVASNRLVPQLTGADIHDQVMGSDHCPVELTLDCPLSR